MCRDQQSDADTFASMEISVGKRVRAAAMQINLGIGLPLVNSLSHTSFWDSWVRMERPDFVYLRPKMPCHPSIEEIRNSITAQALDAGCTHLLMMDTDQIYAVDTVTRLLEWARTGLDIVTAKVHRRYPPFDPLLMRRCESGNGKYTGVPVGEWKSGGLVEVDATGTGCMLISRDVLEAVKAPWFEVVRAMNEDGSYTVTGEDVHFCEKARAAGFRIFVDCGIHVDHLADLAVNEGTFFVYKQMERLRKEDGN